MRTKLDTSSAKRAVGVRNVFAFFHAIAKRVNIHRTCFDALTASNERVGAALAGSRERAQGEHPFMPCQPGSCALPHPLPAPDESGCHWPYGNVFFGGIKPYRNGDVICMLTEAQHRRHGGQEREGEGRDE